jgi:CRP-like cAMP-binding protein
MNNIASLLGETAFFKNFDPLHLAKVADCGTHMQFKAGEYIFHAGDELDLFYVLRSGKVTLEINAPGRGPMIIQTLQEGDLLSWSWILAPYKKYFDARAIELTRTIGFSGECVRRKCDEDPRLGYELVKRIAGVMSQRLQATRLQLLDLYDHT